MSLKVHWYNKFIYTSYIIVILVFTAKYSSRMHYNIATHIAYGYVTNLMDCGSAYIMTYIAVLALLTAMLSTHTNDTISLF